jgi:hypothetical protein
MPVGSSFDHGHDIFARMLASKLKIMMERRTINFGPSTWRRFGHGERIIRNSKLEIPKLLTKEEARKG